MTADAMLPYRLPRARAEQQNMMAEGRVLDITAAGMRFTVPDWDGGKHVFGPAPWPMSRVEPVDHTHPLGGSSASHDHPETVPARGARALVLFLGEGIERPWVLNWWPA